MRLRLPLLPRRHGHGRRPVELYPRIQGHEVAATIVEDVGPDCPPGLAAGQRVAIWPVIACGSCYACRIGRGNACEQISLIGIHMDGALQERFSVPATQVVPRRRPGRARSPPSSSPCRSACAPCVRGRVAAGERVSSSAPGRSARPSRSPRLDRGASVLLVDRLEPPARARRRVRRRRRCDRARRRSRRARPRVGGRRAGPEVVFEATGVAGARAARRSTLVAQAGRVVVVGLSTHEAPLRVGALPFRSSTCSASSCCGAGDFAEAVELVARRRDAVAPPDHARVRPRAGARGDRLRDRASGRGDEGAWCDGADERSIRGERDVARRASSTSAARARS